MQKAGNCKTAINQQEYIGASESPPPTPRPSIYATQLYQHSSAGAAEAEKMFHLARTVQSVS